MENWALGMSSVISLDVGGTGPFALFQQASVVCMIPFQHILELIFFFPGPCGYILYICRQNMQFTAIPDISYILFWYINMGINAVMVSKYKLEQFRPSVL